MEETLIHHLHSYFPQLMQWRSTKKFKSSKLYQEIAPELERILNGFEWGHFVKEMKVAGSRNTFRAVSWNVERGMMFDGIVTTLKEHFYLSKADIYFCPETDLGMARSGNRNISRELAESLGFNYLFVPAYLNLEKGNGQEIHIEGENNLGLHGNSIFSKWPLKNPRAIRLKNCKDKMRGKEKRLGSQQAVVVDVSLPSGDLRAVCLHLDAHSSQRQRFEQMKTILDTLQKENWKGPTLIGGDWNTSTYFASHAFFAFFSFWRKVAMGPKYVVENHYPYPERYFERRLFEFVERKGFDYKNFNALGVSTMHYHLNDEEKKKNMRDWTPKFFQPFIDWAMKKAEGLAAFKIDWFAAEHLKPLAGSQKVIGNLEHEGKRISDHDAIAVDFEIISS